MTERYPRYRMAAAVAATLVPSTTRCAPKVPWSCFVLLLRFYFLKRAYFASLDSRLLPRVLTVLK
eukprot:1579722-Pyramimonas_sp.AAC.1